MNFAFALVQTMALSALHSRFKFVYATYDKNGPKSEVMRSELFLGLILCFNQRKKGEGSHIDYIFIIYRSTLRL